MSSDGNIDTQDNADVFSLLHGLIYLGEVRSPHEEVTDLSYIFDESELQHNSAIFIRLLKSLPSRQIRVKRDIFIEQDNIRNRNLPIQREGRMIKWQERTTQNARAEVARKGSVMICWKTLGPLDRLRIADKLHFTPANIAEQMVGCNSVPSPQTPSTALRENDS
uniref:Uncharacterized protein n=1 Tax=Glossina austeni TaxID=7395 RepID=A0A1A9UNC9_GLOAU